MATPTAPDETVDTEPPSTALWALVQQHAPSEGAKTGILLAHRAAVSARLSADIAAVHPPALSGDRYPTGWNALGERDAQWAEAIRTARPSVRTETSIPADTSLPEDEEFWALVQRHVSDESASLDILNEHWAASRARTDLDIEALRPAPDRTWLRRPELRQRDDEWIESLTAARAAPVPAAVAQVVSAVSERLATSLGQSTGWEAHSWREAADQAAEDLIGSPLAILMVQESFVWSYSIQRSPAHGEKVWEDSPYEQGWPQERVDDGTLGAYVARLREQNPTRLYRVVRRPQTEVEIVDDASVPGL